MWRNAIKCRYIYFLPSQNLARNGRSAALPSFTAINIYDESDFSGRWFRRNITQLTLQSRTGTAMWISVVTKPSAARFSRCRCTSPWHLKAVPLRYQSPRHFQCVFRFNFHLRLLCLGVQYYRKTSSINRTKSPNLNVSCILLQLSSLNPSKPCV